MELSEIRNRIDAIDEELVRLFDQRMTLAAQVADYKKANNLPIFVPAREREILHMISKKVDPELKAYTQVLYATLFELSRSYQSKYISVTSPLYEQITYAMETTQTEFPQEALVACMGIEGDSSQLACEKIFKSPTVSFVKNPEDVFTSVMQGKCQYGILPIDNSITNSVSKVYNLIIQHNFYIACTVSLNDSSDFQGKGNTHTRFICITNNLEVYPNSDKTTIRMVLSHKPDALYKVMARLYTLGINVIKLVSCPLPDREFESMFYFDLEISIYSDAFVQLMCGLDDLCQEFYYLGSYSEVI